MTSKFEKLFGFENYPESVKKLNELLKVDLKFSDNDNDGTWKAKVDDLDVVFFEDEDTSAWFVEDSDEILYEGKDIRIVASHVKDYQNLITKVT